MKNTNLHILAGTLAASVALGGCESDCRQYESYLQAHPNATYETYVSQVLEADVQSDYQHYHQRFVHIKNQSGPRTPGRMLLPALSSRDEVLLELRLRQDNLVSEAHDKENKERWYGNFDGSTVFVHENTPQENASDAANFKIHTLATHFVCDALMKCSRDADSLNTDFIVDTGHKVFSALKQNGTDVEFTSKATGKDDATMLKIDTKKSFLIQSDDLINQIKQTKKPLLVHYYR